MAVEKKTIEIG